LASELPAAIERLVHLVEERRYIEAGALLERAQAMISSAWRGKGDGSRDARCKSTEAAACLKALLEPGGALAKLPERYAICKCAYADLHDDAEWQLSSYRNGTRVQYRRTRASLSVKIEGELDGVRAADTLFIWREASLYRHWFPLVTASSMLHEAHPSEVSLHLQIANSLVHADMPLHGWGCVQAEEGYVLMVVRPLHEANLPKGVQMPPRPSARRLFPPQRLPAEINIVVAPSKTVAEGGVRMIYSISFPLHPNVPTWAVNHLLAHGMAHIFSNLRIEARKMPAADPASHHVRRAAEPSGASALGWISRAMAGPTGAPIRTQLGGGTARAAEALGKPAGFWSSAWPRQT
jgi:hypothetical protein